MNCQPEKKKRGRKPKSDKDKTGTPETVQTQHIIQLNINVNDDTAIQSQYESYETDFCKYDPDTLNIPNAYVESDSFMSHPSEIKGETVNNSDDSKSSIKVINCSNKSSSSNIHTKICDWCCHSFDTAIVGMPISFKNKLFNVIGCYCSFECCCADNFYSNVANLNIWEVYNLLNLMANSFQYTTNVLPAPPRKCLKMFGGYMDIDMFRNFKNTSKILTINHHPMVSMVEQIEELNDFYHKNQTEGFNFDKDRLDKYEKKVIQEQTENIEKNFKNTLNSKMSIITK
tara:strand:- start:576 stop:1433 length:858 start_codon:yes stop_codon:yes gene_type:complete